LAQQAAIGQQSIAFYAKTIAAAVDKQAVTVLVERCQPIAYHAVYGEGQGAKCQHQWLIEFAREPHSLQAFADILDHKLQEINSDYEAKRYKNITLQPLQIIKARPGLFNDWLKAKGKLGGQHKIPRLSNSRQYIDELIEINSAAKND
jgi:inorganic triphosphatase YgiF